MIFESSLGCCTVMRICDLVEQAINTGYLDLKAEEQLRKLLGTKKYEGHDLRLFMKLQLAAMNGEVKLESHQRRQFLSNTIASTLRGEVALLRPHPSAPKPPVVGTEALFLS